MENPDTPSPRRPKPKKESSLTMRMTRETRDKLEAAARAEVRSVSEIAERWIDQAADGHARFEELLGGVQVADAIRAMIQLARDVEAHFGVRVYESHLARAATFSGWKEIMRRSVGLIPLDADEKVTAALRLRATEMVRGLERTLRRAELADKLLAEGFVDRLKLDPLGASGMGILSSGERAPTAIAVDLAALWDAFRQATMSDALIDARSRDDLIARLTLVRDQVVPQLRAEITETLVALADYQEAEERHRDAIIAAAQMGKDLAGGYRSALQEEIEADALNLPPALRLSKGFS